MEKADGDGSLLSAINIGERGVKALFRDARDLCKSMGDDGKGPFEVSLFESRSKEGYPEGEPLMLVITLKLADAKERLYIGLDGNGTYSCTLRYVASPNVRTVSARNVSISSGWPPLPDVSEWLAAKRRMLFS